MSRILTIVLASFALLAVVLAIPSAADRPGVRVRAGPVEVDVNAPPAVQHPHRATTFLGMPVENPAGKKLGTIEDLVIDISSGRIHYVVLSPAETFKASGELAVVPFGTLRILEKTAEPTHLVLTMDERSFAAAPRFGRNEWPDFSDRDWIEEIRGAHRQPAEAAQGPLRR